MLSRASWYRLVLNTGATPEASNHSFFSNHDRFLVGSESWSRFYPALSRFNTPENAFSRLRWLLETSNGWFVNHFGLPWFITYHLLWLGKHVIHTLWLNNINLMAIAHCRPYSCAKFKKKCEKLIMVPQCALKIHRLTAGMTKLWPRCLL